MQRFRWSGFRVAILLVLVSVMQPAWGQEVSGAITGTVLDPANAPVSGATVTARDTDRGTVYTTHTNDSGIFNFSRIPIGNYEVRATATGFETAVQPPFTLVLNQTARLEFKMKVGAVSESIEVTSEAPQLQTDTTQVNTLIDSNTVNNIPLATRNYIELTLLAPGSITPDPANFNNGNNTAAGARPYINGNREQANNFLLDGLDNNQVSDNLVGFTPAPDAIQEFNLITSDAPAEFGRYMGGIVSTTIKSGTNQFHGDVWEYFRNDVLNANNWENGFLGPNAIPKPKLRWNMFGGTFGGPIIKNKLFFFVDYQGQRFDHPATTQAITVFTNAERGGDFSQLCTAGFNNGLCNNPAQQIVNPLTNAPFPNNQIPMNLENVVAKNLFASKFYPTPVNNSPTNNAYNTTTQAYNSNQGDAKLDWNISNKDTLFGRYSQSYQTNPLSSSDPITPAQMVGSSVAPIQSGVGQWTHTFSPNLLNEARFGINYIKLNTVNNGVNPSVGDLGTELGIANANTVGPGLLLLGFGGGTAPAPGTGTLSNIGGNVVVQSFHDSVAQFEDGVVITHGKHVIRTGFQMWRYHINTFYSGNSGEFGSILFGGAFSGNPASDFFLGYAGATGKGISGTGGWHQSSWTFAGYVQDNWRLTPTLTLNLGLRYEANTPWVEQNNRQANLGLNSGQLLLAGVGGNSRALYNSVYGLPDWQPRIGFAWSPASYSGKLVVRGAYSISSYLEGTGTNLRLPQNVPFQPPELDASYNSPTYMTQEGPGGSLPGNPLVGANFRVWAPTVQPAVDQQWNVTIQQELANNLTLQMGYVGQKAQHLMVPMPYLQNQLVNGTVEPGIYFQGNPTLRSELGQVSGTASVGYMNYNALQVVLQKRYSNGLQGQLAYTWSHCLTNNSGYYGTWGSQTQATPGSPYYQNLYDPHADYANCYMDSRNILSAYATYDLPFGKGRKYGSNMNSVANAVVGNWQANAIVSIHSGFPLAVYEATDTSGTGSRGPRPNCTGLSQSLGTSQPVIVNGVFQGYQYINVAGYSQPATGTFGNCPLQGPNVGPGYTDTDLSLLKNFHFTERMYLQFRTDFLNAFNNVQLSHPNVNFPSSTFGLINTSMDTPRNIQFALKFYF